MFWSCVPPLGHSPFGSNPFFELFTTPESRPPPAQNLKTKTWTIFRGTDQHEEGDWVA